MADLTQDVNGRIKALREAKAVAEPTQAQDSTTSFVKDIPTQRAADPDVANDLNTTLDQTL